VVRFGTGTRSRHWNWRRRLRRRWLSAARRPYCFIAFPHVILRLASSLGAKGSAGVCIGSEVL